MAYDAEIRVKTKVDNSEVIKLEASLETAEKKAEEAGKSLDHVQLNPGAAQSVQQAAAGMDSLADKARKAAAETKELEAAFKNTKIHLADGSTMDWDGNVIEEAVKETEELSQEQARLAGVAEQAAESMRNMAEETRQVNQAARGMEGAPARNTVAHLTPIQNMLAFIKKSFQDIPVLFGGIADKFTAKTRQMGTEWDNLSDKAAHYKGVLQELEGKGLGFGDKEYDTAYTEWKKAERAVQDYKARLTGVKKKHIGILSGLKRVGDSVNGIFRKMGAVVKKFFSSTQSGAKKTGGALGTMASRMKGLALSLLIFNWISKGFNAMVSGMKKGFENLMRYSSSYANSVQMLKNAQATLGNSFTAAFAPIIQAAIPYLVELINWVNRAVNALGQLFAYLTGKSTWTKATAVQGGYNAALNGTASAAKKAYGALAKFDDLDVLQKKEEPSGGSGGGGTSGGGFEEVPIDSEIKKFGDKIKDIMSKLFNPFKEAWEREGDFVMRAWKYALEEVKKLLHDIGRDFLEVWNQEATIRMFQDILKIVGYIGLIVGNLAKQFREAWNENETGLHILENIRDLFAIIIHNIKVAAVETVLWSKKLDFSPILTAFENFTESLKPVVDAISGILTDFYRYVLLPLGKWAIEKGLPELLDIFTRFNDEVDWESLRENFKELWKHLEPFAETVGEGLLIFIDRLSVLVANFLNSEALVNFLDRLEEWMEDVTPEDVADGIETLAKAFLIFKGAILLLDGALAACKIVDKLSSIRDSFRKFKEIIAPVVEFIKGINWVQIFSSMNPGMIGELGLKIESLLEGTIFDPRSWDGVAGDVYDSIDQFITGIVDTIGTGITEAFKAIGTILTGTFNWDATCSVFGEAGEHFAKALDGESIGKNILLGILKGFTGALGLIVEPVGDFFHTLFDAICSVFGIHSPAKAMEPLGQYIILGVVQGFLDNIAAFTDAIQTWWDEAVAPWFTIERWLLLFDNIWLSFQTKWAEIVDWWQNTALYTWWEENVAPWFTIERWAELLENIKEAFTQKWEEIKEKTVELLEELRGKIEEKYAKIKEKTEELQKKFSEFKDKVSEAFTFVKDKIINSLSPVIDKLKEFIQWVKDAIQAVKDFFASGYEEVGGTVGKVSKSGGGGVSRAAAYSASNAAMAAAIDSIPHLASGSVIRGGNPFLAVLGDQPAGHTNIEAPLSTIRQAVRDELSGMNFGAGQLKVTLQVNGADLAQATLQDFLSEMNRQGLDVEVLGVT